MKGRFLHTTFGTFFLGFFLLFFLFVCLFFSLTNGCPQPACDCCNRIIPNPRKNSINIIWSKQSKILKLSNLSVILFAILCVFPLTFDSVIVLKKKIFLMLIKKVCFKLQKLKYKFCCFYSAAGNVTFLLLFCLSIMSFGRNKKWCETRLN